jgi:hypothetical protein
MKPLRGEAGNAAVETVLLAPALLLVLTVMVAGGRILSVRSAVETVAREAARSASQSPSTEHAVSTAGERAEEVALELRLDPARLNVRTQTGSFCRGCPMEVSVRYLVRLEDLPAFGLLPGSFEVSASHIEFVEKFKSR